MTLPSGRKNGGWGKAWYVLGKEVSSLGIGWWGGVIVMGGPYWLRVTLKPCFQDLVRSDCGWLGKHYSNTPPPIQLTSRSTLWECMFDFIHVICMIMRYIG